MSYLEDLYSLKNRIAIVTGAARGNGRGVAEALLRAGAEVVLVDILRATLHETVSFFASQGLRAHAKADDLTDPLAPDRVVEEVFREHGQLDIVVNNAGITISDDVVNYSVENWERTYRINLKAPFLMSRAAARVMKKNNRGSIINITSINAEMAFPNNPAYVTFKGALKMLSKSLALDLGKYKIRVNNIGPGYFRTAMTERSWSDGYMRSEKTSHTVLGRWGDPDQDLAGAVIFLASDASTYVTGQDLYIDGGWLIKGL
jgi:NAD(P)-dependent dehydrogenase (short-subunit alcohol dehydrogenase family)